MFSRRGELYAAAAAIDPKWAVALVEVLPDDPDLKIREPKNSARLAVAAVLGRAGEERYRSAESPDRGTEPPPTAMRRINTWFCRSRLRPAIPRRAHRAEMFAGKNLARLRLQPTAA